ncbi:MAG: M67 family metallopeptidase [Candidatus Bathyarchaeia archaeon]
MSRETEEMNISLTKEQIGFLIEETKKKYPIEACGLLFGEMNGKKAVVTKIVTFQNVLKSSTNFQINMEEFLKTLLKAEEDGMQLIGFFHSHPAAPQPSSTDIEYMRLWPGNIWLIISSIDYDIAAYQVSDAVIKKVNIEVENAQ